MRIVVVGDGMVGNELTSELTKEGHDIVVIDNNLNALEQSINVHDAFYIKGNGASIKIQREAGVDKADLLIAATSADETNMLSCFLAKKLGAKHTIARVRDPEYAEQLLFMKDEIGLSLVINPEFAAAAEIFRVLRLPSALQVESFNKGRSELVEFIIGKDSPLIGLKVREVAEKHKPKVLICAIERGEEVFIPDGNFILNENDRLNITAPPSSINTFFKNMGLFKNRVKNVMIIGGERISYYLAKQLEGIGIDVKIIEKDIERSKYLSEMLPKTTIIHGDGTDQDLLNEEDIDTMDAFVSLTSSDGENVIVAMYAKTLGVNKVIAVVNRVEFLSMLSGIGVDSFVSPKRVIASQVMQYVRAMENSYGSNVETLHRMVNGKVEALEFKIRVKDDFLGKSLKDLELKPNTLIANISRNNKLILPGGDDYIAINDSVLVVTTNENLNDFKDIFR